MPKKQKRFYKVGFKTVDAENGKDLVEARRNLRDQIHGTSASRDKYEEDMLRDAKLVEEKVPDKTDVLLGELIKMQAEENALEARRFARLNPPLPPPVIMGPAPPPGHGVVHDADLEHQADALIDTSDVIVDNDRKIIEIASRSGAKPFSMEFPKTPRGKKSLSAERFGYAVVSGKRYELSGRMLDTIKRGESEWKKLRNAIKNKPVRKTRWIHDEKNNLIKFAKAVGGQIQATIAPDYTTGHGLPLAIQKPFKVRGRGRGAGFKKSGPGRGKFAGQAVIRAMKDQLNEGLSMIGMGYHSKQHVRDMRDLANRLYLLGKLSKKEQDMLRKALS